MQQTSQINPVTFMASANGQRVKKGWSDKLQGALLTIATTALIGNFTYLWNLQGTVTLLKERDQEKNESINVMIKKIDDMSLLIQDMRLEMTRMEYKHNKTN